MPARAWPAPHTAARPGMADRPLARPSAPQRIAPLPRLGRSLGVCAVLAGAFAGLVLALGASGDVQATVAAEAEPGLRATMPAPRIVLAPLVPRIAAAPPAPAAALPSDPDAGTARIDRVSYDFLVLNSGAATDPEEILSFGPMRIRRHLVETIVRAARACDVDPVLLMAIADRESSFSTRARARTSSATGLFQFVERTWLRVMRDFGAKHGFSAEAQAIALVEDEPVIADPAERARILDLRRDPYVAAVLAGEMLNRDRARIARRAGRDLTMGETYIAHFLGPDDAERLIDKLSGEPAYAAAHLLPRPARANRAIFFTRRGRRARSLSVAEVHRKFEAMMGVRAERYREVSEVVTAAPVLN